MKKILLSMAATVLATGALAADFVAGTHYQVVGETATAKDEVRLYFSYNCGFCNTFDPTYEDMEEILETNESPVAVERTHVDFVGRNGRDMTWARSMGHLLGVEHKVGPLIFNAIHVEKRSLSRDDVRDLFISVGVDGEEFDSTAKSFALAGLETQQRKQTVDAEIRGVPTVIINGKYQVDRRNVNTAEDLAELVDYLATLD
ncbi:DsbA family protein [Salinibius halmophilus]|uniref:DsbA family protein n=1 Tax=Salinibius halmophilus TaxID=1853216 RepID=UPI000E66EF0F|nr:DsbA family protein [Salinibius halmophilus]